MAPSGATHFKLVSAGSDINFTEESSDTAYFESAYLPLNDVPTAAVNITHALTANSSNPLFLFMGILFSQEVNGVQYPLLSGSFNSLNIVQVSGV